MQASPQPTGSTSSQPAIASRSLLHILWRVLVLALLAWFVWWKRQEIADAIHLLRIIQRLWLFALVVAAFGLHALLAWVLAVIMDRIGRPVPYREAFITRAEREMVATMMPMGGLASWAVLVQRFGRYDVTPAIAALVTLLYSVIGHLSFLIIVIPTITWFTLTQGSLAVAWVGLAVVVLSGAAIIALVASLLRGAALPHKIDRLLPRSIHDARAQIRQITIRPAGMLLPLTVSFAADLAGVAGVWVALHAVHGSSSLMVAMVAYVIGTLMLLAAPVFQGVGFVEVSMTVAMQQMGVSTEHAIAATLLCRVVDTWIPVALGAAVQLRNYPRLRTVPVVVPAVWSGFNGALLLASALPLPGLQAEATELRSGGGPLLLFMAHPAVLSRTISLSGGFLLLLLSLRLLRGERTAWLVALGLSIALSMNHLLSRHDHAGILVSGTTVAILLLYRDRFVVRPDRPSIRNGIQLLLTSLVITYGYTVASLWVADRRVFGQEFSFRRSFSTAFDVLFWFNDGGLHPHSRLDHWTLRSFHLLMLMTLVMSVVVILRPLVWRLKPNTSDADRARDIIGRVGSSSLDRFRYWPDKFQFFPRNTDAVVSYGVSDGVALSLGSPSAGGSEDLGAAIVQFRDYCRQHNLVVAFHQVPEADINMFHRLGFVSVRIGQEAVVDATTFSLAGGSMKKLRSVANKAKRQGLTVIRHDPRHSDELLSQLRSISDDWLTLEGRRERTFTLGQFREAYLQEGSVLVLYDSGHYPVAFINMIPDGVPGEVTFDLMRHRVHAPNGAMDLLMLALIDDARNMGKATVSLGMVPFVSTGTAPADDLLGRSVQRLAKPMSHYFASESLFDYKEKFRPTWDARYLVVPNLTVIPRVALALTNLAEVSRPSSLIVRKLASRLPRKRAAS